MRQTRKSSLFLIELIIAILFFSLSSAVCVTLFSASHMKTKESEYRTVAILEAQSIAELFRNDSGEIDTILDMTTATEVLENQYVYYLDEEGNYAVFLDEEIEEGEVPYYKVTLVLTEEEQLLGVDIYIVPPNDEDTIVELSTKIYVPLERENL